MRQLKFEYQGQAAAQVTASFRQRRKEMMALEREMQQYKQQENTSDLDLRDIRGM
jgi:hypothetical protein